MISLSTAVGRAPLRDRRNDLYETPECATRALLHIERLPRRIWEPAAGRGAIVRVLRAHGHEVVASDLIDYGEQTHFSRRDFLLEHKHRKAASASSLIHLSHLPNNSLRTRSIYARA